MADIFNKKILMFSPFGTCKHYTDEFAEELKKRGAEVRLYDERPSQSSLVKIYLYLFQKIAPQFFFNYIKRVVNTNKSFDPDIVFVVRGQGFNEGILKYLHSNFPKSVFILFQWDSLSFLGKDFSTILDLYDYSFSFDRNDVAQYKQLVFRPTCYASKYANIASNTDYQYDVSFVGTLYNSRWALIKHIKTYFTAQGISSFFYLYLPSWTLYLWDFIFKGTFIDIRTFKFKPINYEEFVKVVSESRCVLDIVNNNQNGLSLRAFEAMAAHRKYITNNKEIVKYDFYNPRNILVIDTDNLQIPIDFVRSEFEPVSPELLYKYSVSGFIDDVFRPVIEREKRRD